MRRASGSTPPKPSMPTAAKLTNKVDRRGGSDGGGVMRNSITAGKRSEQRRDENWGEAIIGRVRRK